MTFTTTDIILIIGAISTALVTVITAWKTQAKVAAVETKADTITGHVNGQRTIAEQQIGSLREEVSALRTQISDLKQAAALIAQAALQSKDKL